MLINQLNIGRFLFYPAVLTYIFPFKFWNKSEISVYLTVDGEDTLMDPANYDITDLGAGGSLTIHSDFVAPAGTTKLTIVRTVEMVQPMDFKNGEPIDAENIENNLDSIVAMIQQTAEKADRCIQLPISEDAQTYVMPGTNERQGKVLGFDASGENFETYANPNEAIGSIAVANNTMDSGAANILTFTKLSGNSFSIPFFNGQKGDKGDKGEQGERGFRGEQGPTGAQGPQGVAGATGPQGIQGIQGPQGPSGLTVGTIGEPLFSIESGTLYLYLPTGASNPYEIGSDGVLYMTVARSS